jgi:hypothetical protein
MFPIPTMDFHGASPWRTRRSAGNALAASETIWAARDGPAVNVACLIRFEGQSLDDDPYAFDFIANVK